jgi:hypothetical protein
MSTEMKRRDGVLGVKKKGDGILTEQKCWNKQGSQEWAIAKSLDQYAGSVMHLPGYEKRE